TAATASATSNIEVKDIKFEPVGPGQNVLHVTARNPGGGPPTGRWLGVEVQTHWGDGREWKGSRGVGYRQFKREQTVKHGPNLPDSGEVVDIRIAYQLPAPLPANTVITVQLFDQKSDWPVETHAFSTRKFT